MPESVILSEEGIIILLLAIAIVMSIVLRRVKFPYTIGLFIIGFVVAYFIAPNVAFLSPISGYVPNSDLILYLFLPPLIFESAIALNSRLLFKNIIPVLVMAIAGLVISVFVIGFVLSYLTPIPLIYVLVFGALISATDPVAVIALFKDLGVPKRLFTLVEGESLLNDASAIVTFNIIMGIVALQAYSGGASSLEDISVFFAYSLLVSFAGGIFIGSIMAFAIYGTIRASPDHPHLHQTVSLVIAYSAFLVSEAVFDLSGVVAVVAAGIIVNRMTSKRLGPAVREDLYKFWDYIGFLANSMIFLLVGITITSLGEPYLFSWDFVALAGAVIFAVIVARAVSVYGLYSVTNVIERDRPVSRSYQTVIFWGGLRGAVCLALVLSLPKEFPYRDLITAFTVVVVVFTIIVQGMTTGPLIRFFKLQRPDNVLEFERLWLSVRSAKESRKALEGMKDKGSIPPETFESVSSGYETAVGDLREKFTDFWKECPDDNSIRELFWIKAIEHEQECYRHMYDAGLVTPGVLERLLYDADTRVDKIQSEGIYPSGTRYYSPVLRIGARFKKGISPLFGKFRKGGRKEEVVDELFLMYAVSAAADETRNWVLDVADETGSGRAIVDPVVEEYGRMHESAKAGFRALSESSPEAVNSFYDYLVSRIAISGAKKMLFDMKAEGFFDEKDLEAEISRLRREESRALKKVREI